jgi:hypothetical protein
MLKDRGYTNNKIVFDSEDYENNAEDAVKQTMPHNISSFSSDIELLGESDSRRILFEDSSDDAEEGVFKIKTQFEGSKGQKVSVAHHYHHHHLNDVWAIWLVMVSCHFLASFSKVLYEA